MTEQVLLEIVQVATTQALGRTQVAAARRAEQYHVLDRHAGHLVSTLQASLVGRTFDVHTETVRVPASWWQMFKAAHFPAFMLRRFPVKHWERKVVAKVVKVCPHLDLPPHDFRHVEYLIDVPATA